MLLIFAFFNEEGSSDIQYRSRSREGLACVLDEKTKSYQPDFDVVLIYDGDPSSQDILYYEQDAMITTLNNWMHSKFSFTELQNLDCELYIPEETEEI